MMCYNIRIMKNLASTTGLLLALVMLSPVARAEYSYIISDNSVNESWSAVSSGVMPLSGENSAFGASPWPIEGRYRTWGFSLGIGIDPTLGLGYYIIIR